MAPVPDVPSWCGFFKKYFQKTVGKLFLEKMCTFRDPYRFFHRFVMVQDGDGEGCFIEVEAYLFFRYPGKADADKKLPAGIRQADGRVKCFLFRGIILFHALSPSGNEGLPYSGKISGPGPV